MDTLSLLLTMSVGLVLLCFIPQHEVSMIRAFSLMLCFLALLATVHMWWCFDASAHSLQMLVILSRSHLCFGVDAMGLSLMVLTASLFPIIIMLLRTTAGFLTFILLEILLLGALSILDLLGFYVLFEATLILLFLLIGRYPYGSLDAAYKIVMYTMAGSLVLLPMLLCMYSESGTTNLLYLICAASNSVSVETALQEQSSVLQLSGSALQKAQALYEADSNYHTLSGSSVANGEARQMILGSSVANGERLQTIIGSSVANGEMSQTIIGSSVANGEINQTIIGSSLANGEARQMILGWGMLLVFAIKIPLMPVHLWLPEAHVSAPTAGSVLLAGVLLKLGGLGFIRFMLPTVPVFCVSVFPLVACLCLVSFVFSSLSTLRQVDLKKIVAYSSIAHMSLVTLAIFSQSELSVFSSTFMMVAHGVVSPALFLLVGLLYDRAHTKFLLYFSGLQAEMPIWSSLFFVFTLANLSFPLFPNFIAEMLCLVSLFAVHELYAYVFCVCQVLGAAYGFWAFNRVVHGVRHLSHRHSTFNQPHPTSAHAKHNATYAFVDLSRTEWQLVLPLLIGVLWLGFKPMP